MEHVGPHQDGDNSLKPTVHEYDLAREHRRSASWRALKWAALAIAVLGAVAAFGWRIMKSIDARHQSDQPQAATRLSVSTVRVSRRDMPTIVSLTGVVRPLSEVDVYSKVSGRLERVSVEVGDRVKQDQVLARVEHREIELQNRQAAAQGRAAAAALEQARSNFGAASLQRERYETLQRADAVSQAEVDQVESSFLSAQAAVRAAEAQLALAQASIGIAAESLRNTSITSPIDGTIIKRMVDRGTQIAAGKPLFNVQDSSTLRLAGSVSAEDFANLREGYTASVTAEDLPGANVVGKIVALSPSLDPQTRRASVEIALNNGDGRLLPNMFASAVVETGKQTAALVIPAVAVIPIASERGIYVVRDGKARLLQPRLGATEGGLIRVDSVLTEGEEVIVSGQAGLADGRAVTVVNHAQADGDGQ
ncbi:MAG TPA: efflux RND transporter periplasmic adaptor subunit [Polyangiaceae bacterium]|nr:efflux RND transporter periplasmic adaptor subunit [Polyangiaceae bacterium]